MKKLLLVILLFSAFRLPFNCSLAQDPAQMVNSRWFSGNSTFGMYFNPLNAFQPEQNNVKPTPYGAEGAAVATAYNGDLLFYTDGERIFDRNNNPMPGGTGLGGNASSAQAVAICPKVDVCNQYYVFSNSTSVGSIPATSNELSYVIVDMNANGGLGSVITPPTFLLANVSEAMVIIPRQGTEDFWLVGKFLGQTNYYAFRIINGIILAPIPTLSIGPSFYNFTITPNPAGNRVAVCGINVRSVFTMDFDPITGLFSSYTPIQSIPNPYDAEWSADGSKLYYSSWTNLNLFQYDFNFPLNPPVNLYISKPGVNGGGLRMGPDGKIYYISDWIRKHLSVIASPNEPGALCDFRHNYYDGGVPVRGLNFPEMSAVPATAPSVAPDGFICSGGSYTLQAFDGQTYAWSASPADPSLAGQEALSNPTVSPVITTTYMVTITDARACTSTHDIIVNLNPVPSINTMPAIPFCIGQEMDLVASGSGTFAWSSSPSGTYPAESEITVSPTVNTMYTVTVTYAPGCSGTSQLLVPVNPLPPATITASGPTDLCPGKNVTLTAAAAATYEWSNGATTQSVNVNAQSLYQVTITSSFGCNSTAEIMVTNQEAPGNVITADGPTTFCQGGFVTLTASTGASYLWSSSQTTQSILASTTGNYKVTVTNSFGCTATAQRAVTVNPRPVSSITANPSLIICAGQSTTLTATGGGTYRWSTTETTPSITVTPATTTQYTVTVSNASCSTTVSATVTVDQVSINAGADKNFCVGSPGVTIGPPTSLANHTYSWTPVSGLSNPNIHNPTASPAATTNYTVVITSLSSGCTASDAVVVRRFLPPTINAGPDRDYCIGSPGVQIGPPATTSGYSYSWTPTAGLSNPNIHNPVASPLVTTNYTVVKTDINTGCTGSDVVVVRSNNPPSINAGVDKVYCIGSPGVQIGPATNLANHTYSWSPTTGLSSSNIYNPTASPNVSTNYTVIITNTITTCSASDAVLVRANNPPRITATASPTFVCGGQSSTLTATGGASYDWADDQGSTYSGSSVTVNPIQTTSYWVTVTGENGCTATAGPVVITYSAVCPCGCPANRILSGTVTESPISGRTYCIDTDIKIQGNVNFLGSEFKIAEGVEIFVNDGSTFTVQGSHLYSCGDFLWDGIRTGNNSNINIIGSPIIFTPSGFSPARSAFIEDAYAAVEVGNLLRGGLLQKNSLTVNDAIFNRNYIAIIIDNQVNPGGVASTYPVSIQHTLFTGRNIPFTAGSGFSWPTAATLKTENTGIPLWFPEQSPYQVQNRLPTILKTNTYGSKYTIGVYVANCSGKNTSNGFIEVRIGVPASGNAFNLFDQGSFGIYSQSANVGSYNNVFQHTTVSSGQGAGQEAGIFAYNNNDNRMRAIASGNFINKFYDCHHAAYITGAGECNLNNCNIRSSQRITDPPGYHKGSYGLYIIQPSHHILNMNNNSIYNVETGISITGTGTGPALININQNTIVRLPGSGVSGTAFQYISKAIDLQGNKTTALNSILNVNSNSITQAYRGISCSKYDGTRLNNNDNVISLINDPNNNQQYGILHTKNVGKISSTQRNSIAANRITGFSITEPNVQGIYTSVCTNQTISCNSTQSLTHGLEFAGLQNPGTSVTSVLNNTMNNHKNGFVLNFNGTAGIIGQQGSNGSPAGNIWVPGGWTNTGPSVGNFKTACLNGSNAHNSPMWVSNTPSQNPSNSGFSQPVNSSAWRYDVGNSTIFTSSGISSTSPCSPIGPGGLGGSISINLSLQERIALDQIAYGYYPNETKFINKHQLYEALLMDSSIIDSSAVLKQFMNNCKGRCIGQLSNIDKALDIGNYALASSLANSLDLEHPTEANYKLYYNLYIKLKTDTTPTDSSNFLALMHHWHNPFTEADRLALMNLSSGCPFTDGSVVYQARTLYNTVYHSSKIFNDNCPEYHDPNRRGIDSNEESEQGLAKIKTDNFDVMVFPNPTTGQVFITPFGLSEGNIQVQVKDVTGKLVYDNKLQFNGGILNFTLSDEVKMGLYFIHVMNPITNETTVKKLVIQK